MGHRHRSNRWHANPQISLRGRESAANGPLRACLTCGLVWTHLVPEHLRTFIDENGTAETKLKLSPFRKSRPEQDLN